jgi:tungstate transport system substrate-binding protein
MDRATYLILRQEIALQILVEKDPDLLNYIAVIRMNPARPTRPARKRLEEAQRLIEPFEKDRYGESLFS